jgi:tRNA pseudouridine38-40 synthase
LNRHQNRYKITLEYHGRDFCGWQHQDHVQDHVLAVQTVIEKAIYKFTKQTVRVNAAGRTDSGVHAEGQVAHFDLVGDYLEHKIQGAINYHSRPHRVAIVDIVKINPDFDARFSAKKRHYVYKILNRKGLNIIESDLKYWIRDDLDVFAMQEGAKHLLGMHDFTSFRASACQSSSPIKTLDEIFIKQYAENIEVHVSALSFLHHMVRNIVGNLVFVGRGVWKPIKIKEILELTDRKCAGPTAPAHGLYFDKVDY